MNKKFTKNIKTYLQILPNVDEEWEYVKILDDQKTIYVRSLQDFGKGKNIVLPNYWTYCTDGVLYNFNKNEIFDLIIKEALKKSITGIDALIFAYGQTGSGKSSTIYGLLDNFESRGLVPRIIEELFLLKEMYKREMKLRFGVTFVEIYKTKVLDVLHNQIVYHPYKHLNIAKIKTEREALKLLFKGESKRKIIYDSYISNLFTSVFTIHIQNTSRIISDPTEKISKIHIIDMAGIDTDGNISCHLKTSLEVGIGNLNKSQLELCLSTINGDLEKGTTSIKDAGILVDYLGSSLDAKNIVRFIGHIRTSKEDIAITLSTLRFSNIAREVKAAKLQSYVKESIELVQNNLQEELDTLHKQIYLNSMLLNDDLSYNISQSRMQQMEKAVEDYIKDKSSDLILLNVTDAKIALNIFKETCIKLAEEIIEIKKQIAMELKAFQTGSKDSVISSKPIDEKVSKTSKSFRSRESQISARKRKSSDKSSRYSKISAQSKNKAVASGSISKSGITIGQILAYDFEGDASKTLKLNSKTLLRTSVDRISEEISLKASLKIGSTSSNLNLQLELGEDFEEVWKAYKNDADYEYEKLNIVLIQLEGESKALLEEFHNKINLLQEIVDLIDLKKNDLLKIQIFKESNMDCCSIDASSLDDAREHVAIRIIELLNNTVQIKEALLELQSEVKININEYHRIKNKIKNDFTNYCTVNNKIKVLSDEQIIQCIEDKINPSEEKLDVHETTENTTKDIFYKFQKELRKTHKKKILESKLKLQESVVKKCEKFM